MDQEYHVRDFMSTLPKSLPQNATVHNATQLPESLAIHLTRAG